MESASARTPCAPRRPPTPWTAAPIWAECRNGSRHANVSTTRLYDRRRSRPEASPTFRVAYRTKGFRFRSGTPGSVLSPCPFDSPVPARLMDKMAGKASWMRRGRPFARWPLGIGLHFSLALYRQPCLGCPLDSYEPFRPISFTPQRRCRWRRSVQGYRSMITGRRRWSTSWGALCRGFALF